MLKHLLNITSIATNNSSLGALNQTFGFTVMNTSGTFAFCGAIIVMCMFATTLRNLIYKVLNLAVLSVFVVALWAYLTDVTFIYVVYILTFVSAVVMLFLSVVLMLPSSAIAVTKRNFIFVLSSAAVSTSETSIVSTIANTALDIVYIFLTFVAVYFISVFIFSWKARGAWTVRGHPATHVQLVDVDLPTGPCERFSREDLKQFMSRYDLFEYADIRANEASVWDCNYLYRWSRKFYFRDYLYGINPTHIVEPDGLYPQVIPDFSAYAMPEDRAYVKRRSYYLRAVPRFSGAAGNYRSNHWLRAAFLLRYEFINFYVRVLEPKLYSKFTGSAFYKKSIAPLKKLANIEENNVESAFYYTLLPNSIKRSIITFIPGGSVNERVYISLYTPWWSPFRLTLPVIFHKNTFLDWLISKLEIGQAYLQERDKSKKPKVVVPPDLSEDGPWEPPIPPKMNGYGLSPEMIIALYETLLDVFLYIKAYILYVRSILRLHPALLLKIIKPSLFNSLWYDVTRLYYRIINFILNNVERPLTSESSVSKPSFSIFNKLNEVGVFTDCYKITLGYGVRPKQYGTNWADNRLIFIKNFIIFIAVNLVFIVIDITARTVVTLSSPKITEAIAQAITTLSVFFTAVPAGLAGGAVLFHYSSYLSRMVSSSTVENLAAIQQVLYVTEPLLLLVSITGLLVALIGAPFFVSKINN